MTSSLCFEAGLQPEGNHPVLRFSELTDQFWYTTGMIRLRVPGQSSWGGQASTRTVRRMAGGNWILRAISYQSVSHSEQIGKESASGFPEAVTIPDMGEYAASKSEIARLSPQ